LNACALPTPASISLNFWMNLQSRYAMEMAADALAGKLDEVVPMAA